MSLLERAIALAARAHAGQRDKAGKPYILHPLRVMLRMESEAEQVTAVLHDLLEDTPWRREGLRRKGFPAPILDALEALTHRPGEPYPRFIERVAGNPLARRVKLADLDDNLRRIPKPTQADRRRMGKYRRARKTLEAGTRTRASGRGVDGRRPGKV
jgi:(p)ppGpp synthase/HD superfamily hydrolase